MTKMTLGAIILCASTSGCVGDSSSTPDGGGSEGGNPVDASNDGAPQQDASTGQCAFGTSHFGGGCKFGP